MESLEKAVWQAKVGRRTPRGESPIVIHDRMAEQAKLRRIINRMEAEKVVLQTREATHAKRIDELDRQVKALRDENKKLRNILKIDPMVDVPKSTPRIATIISAVAKHYKLSINDLLSHRRTMDIVEPRQVAMYVAKHYTYRSLPAIGAAMGDRDHKTIFHAIRKIEKKRVLDSILDQHIIEIEQAIRDWQLSPLRTADDELQNRADKNISEPARLT